jgi:hypothetical protein
MANLSIKNFPTGYQEYHSQKHLDKLLLLFTFTALNGLSESELEDILSCDDDVLNDVYQYWTPPTRRSPPLLLVRLKTDLDQYLGKFIYYDK